MQHYDAIVRVAAECAEDLAADGVAYAEVRYAPELSVEQGLTLDEVVKANLEGFRIGRQRAAAAGHPIVIRRSSRRCARRPGRRRSPSCAVRWRDEGVVGFDIAGPEAGYRPTRHLDAFEHIRHENFHITIHAGESFGLPSIWEALQICGAERLGHGVRIVDDITVRDDGSVHAGPAGRLRSRPPDPARAVPDVERPHGRRAPRSPSIRSTSCGGSGSGSPSTPTTG